MWNLKNTTDFWKFPAQGLNPSRTYNLPHSCGDARSFNPLHQAEDRTHDLSHCSQVLNQLHHGGNFPTPLLTLTHWIHETISEILT